MEKTLLEKINNTLSKKIIDSFEFSGICHSSGNIIQHFQNTYEYSKDSTFYVSLVSFECSSLFANITSKNNKLYYNNGTEDKVLVLTEGCYDIAGIDKAISDDNIKIELVESTGRCQIRLKNNNSIDFTKRDTFRDILGFESKKITTNEYSKNMVDILKTQKIYIYCDIINGSIFNGIPSSILYSFANKYKYGSIIAITPNPRCEKLLTRKTFGSITFSFKNEKNEPIDFSGSRITLSLEIRQQ